MDNRIATKFVNWDVPSLESLKESRVYKLKEKVLNGEKLTREDKDYITREVNSNTYSKSGIPSRGWMFSFSEVLKTYWVKFTYGQISEYRATDKTALRKALYNSHIAKIVEIA